MATITIVLGTGAFPGHATMQINRGDTTTYLGMGPAIPQRPYAVGAYDVVTLPTGVSPVGAVRNPTLMGNNPTNPGEYHYVDAQQYTIKSFTFQISDNQVEAALNAAYNYQTANPNYNYFNGT